MPTISKEFMSVYNKPTNSKPPKMCLLIRTKKLSIYKPSDPIQSYTIYTLETFTEDTKKKRKK